MNVRIIAATSVEIHAHKARTFKKASKIRQKNKPKRAQKQR
jgi:hypothetical protein